MAYPRHCLAEIDCYVFAGAVTIADGNNHCVGVIIVLHEPGSPAVGACLFVVDLGRHVGCGDSAVNRFALRASADDEAVGKIKRAQTVGSLPAGREFPAEEGGEHVGCAGKKDVVGSCLDGLCDIVFALCVGTGDFFLHTSADVR